MKVAVCAFPIFSFENQGELGWLRAAGQQSTITVKKNNNIVFALLSKVTREYKTRFAVE